eukprot:COSAG06_NODE_173_length_21283_cov_14.116220_4_plen_86_part_00
MLHSRELRRERAIDELHRWLSSMQQIGHIGVLLTCHACDRMAGSRSCQISIDILLRAQQEVWLSGTVAALMAPRRPLDVTARRVA